MSWDADLLDEHGNCVGDWNYTHNTNDMIAAAYTAETGEDVPECGGPLGKVIGSAWWRRLDGATGSEGRAYLAEVIRGLEVEPNRFREMNPPNGWGDYDSLLDVLREMRNRVPDYPTHWEVSG